MQVKGQPPVLRDAWSGGVVEIGAHTVTHSVLSLQTPDEQRREIMESKSELESIHARCSTRQAPGKLKNALRRRLSAPTIRTRRLRRLVRLRR